MADKITLRKKWFDDVINDPNFETDEQELAYMIYAAVMYGFNGEKIDIGEVFGKEFKGLNRSMPNIYGQIDNIKNYDFGTGNKTKYDAEMIRDLRLQGLTAKQICKELGISEDKARSLTSNRGWLEAGKILTEEGQTESQKSVQKSQISVQSQTEKSDLTCTDESEKVRNGQKSVQKKSEIFQF